MQTIIYAIGVILLWLVFSEQILAAVLRLVCTFKPNHRDNQTLCWQIERATVYLFNNGLTQDRKAKFSNDTMAILKILCCFNPSIVFLFLSWYRYHVQSIHLGQALHLYRFAMKSTGVQTVLKSMTFDTNNLNTEFRNLYHLCKNNPTQLYFELNFETAIEITEFQWKEPKFVDEVELDRDITDSEPY